MNINHQVKNCKVEITDTNKMKAFAKICPKFHIIISCIGSKTGYIEDAWNVEYTANKNLLDLGISCKVEQFILLSAICVQKPKLEFQHAKLAFEKKLIYSDINYTIVRPTAFFKSLSGQVKNIKNGKKFTYFDDGKRTFCKPISERDLAEYICNCIGSKTKFKKILPIGGGGPAVSSLEVGLMLFKLINEKPRFRSVPSKAFIIIDKSLSPLAFLSSRVKNIQQFVKIAHYYATESMLFYNLETGSYDPMLTPEYGKETLESHYRTLLSSDSIDDELGAHKLF